MHPAVETTKNSSQGKNLCRRPTEYAACHLFLLKPQGVYWQGGVRVRCVSQFLSACLWECASSVHVGGASSEWPYELQTLRSSSMAWVPQLRWRARELPDCISATYSPGTELCQDRKQE